MTTGVCDNALRTTTVCVDHYKEDVFAGRFYNPYMKNGGEFKSLMQMLLKRSSWCYDTIILFSAGMIFSLSRPFIEKILAKSRLVYPVAAVAVVAAYLFFYKKRSAGIEFYSMWAILFMALVVLFTMKVKIGNPVLSFFGSHVFSIYILQRIPMIIFSKLGLASANKYLFVVLCFSATVMLAVIFDKLTDKLDRVLFDRRIKKCA